MLIPGSKNKRLRKLRFNPDGKTGTLIYSDDSKSEVELPEGGFELNWFGDSNGYHISGRPITVHLGGHPMTRKVYEKLKMEIDMVGGWMDES